MNKKTYKDESKGKDSASFKKNRRNTKGGKNYSKRNDDKPLEKGSRDNDPNWYFTSPELANQAAQLSFQSVLGLDSVYGYQVPTIVRIDTVMNPGVTYNAKRANITDFRSGGSASSSSFDTPEVGKAGVNLMAAKLYTLLSSFTGRTASYAPQDVAMMILQISAIAEWSEAIRRVFGLALTYNYRNRSLPLGVIRSMGLDANDLASNLSIYRMRFNVAMSRINQIPLLENIAFIKKSRDVYQRIYMDDPTNMSQLFYYMPRYTFKLDETGDTDGSVLRSYDLPTDLSGHSTMGLWLQELESMITTALESSTLNFIYADLLNMANKLSVSTWQFDYLAENYVVMPEYNANALLQFHNLTIMGDPEIAVSTDEPSVQLKGKISSITNRNVYITGRACVFCDANNNDIVYNPGFSATRSNLPQWFVDMPTDNPTVEDRIEALRYTSFNTGNLIVPSSVSGATIPNNIFIFNVLPDHYVARMVVFTNIDSSSSSVESTIVDKTILSSTGGSVDATSSYIGSLMSQMEHAPLFAHVRSNDASSLRYIYGGLQYYTMVDCKYAQRLLSIMTIGLFDFRVK